MPQVFTPHVERWINNSQEALCQRCQQLETSTQALQGGALSDDGTPPTLSSPAVASSPCCRPHLMYLLGDLSPDPVILQ